MHTLAPNTAVKIDMKAHMPLIAIGKPLKLSLAFPLLHTVRESFPSYGVPSIVNHSLLNHFQ